MKKNLFALVSVLAMVALMLGACATPTTEAPKPTEAAKPTVAAATAAPATAAPKPTDKPIAVTNPPTSAEMVDAIVLEGKKVEVVYWHNRPQADQDFLQKMLDEFNKSNPYGITVRAEIAGASYPDVYNKVSAAIQAGQPPDMSVAYQNQAAFYRGQGAVVDLNPFIKSKKYGFNEADLKDYFQAFIAGDANPQFKGETLGFPTQRSMDVMFYNADWLKKLGYDGPPKDWKTFEEMACKASAETGKFGWAFRHDASNFASQVFSRGGTILAPDGLSYTFNSQAGQDTLSMIQRLFEKKCIVEIPTSERFGEQNRFGNGTVLFVFASSSGLPFYRDTVDKGAKFKWDIAMLPNTGKPAVNLYGASVSVYKTTPERELAAWLVIKFLGEKAQTSRWAIQTGYLPVRASAKDEVVKAYADNKAWGADLAKSYAQMFDWAQYSMIESPVAGYDPVRTLIDKDVMSKVITDPKADVKKLLDDAVKASNALLKENAPK